jgi:small subunit ribosomal protein S15
MHSRKKGKSGSTKPSETTVESWVKYDAKEVELLVEKYAKEGKKPSQIGMHLRDQYGIPDVKALTGKNIEEILDEKDLLGDIPEDLMALIRKRVQIEQHMEDNPKDMTAKRGLQLTESKIRRLTEHYKDTGRLPSDWTYDPRKIKLYLE